MLDIVNSVVDFLSFFLFFIDLLLNCFLGFEDIFNYHVDVLLIEEDLCQCTVDVLDVLGQLA